MDRIGPSCRPSGLCALLWLLGVGCASGAEHAVAPSTGAGASGVSAGRATGGLGAESAGAAGSTGGAPARDTEHPAARLPDGGTAGVEAQDAGGDAAQVPQATAGGQAQPTRCGTPGSGSCASQQFCSFAPESTCGTLGPAGTCEPRPASCDQRTQDPVCGCDRRTYGGSCEAHLAGVSIARSGLCSVAECEAAGGHVAAQIDGGAAVCSERELSWRIAPIANSATLAVCCWSAAQGATCGGFAALPCASGEFCNYERTAGGQGCDGEIADAAGSCETKPQGCTGQDSPVCGCDRHSYATACAAHGLGVSVLHPGACDGSE